VGTSAEPRSNGEQTMDTQARPNYQRLELATVQAGRLLGCFPLKVSLGRQGLSCHLVQLSEELEKR
jgi:hypothetical protein